MELTNQLTEQLIGFLFAFQGSVNSTRVGWWFGKPRARPLIKTQLFRCPFASKVFRVGCKGCDRYYNYFFKDGNWKDVQNGSIQSVLFWIVKTYVLTLIQFVPPFLVYWSQLGVWPQGVTICSNPLQLRCKCACKRRTPRVPKRTWRMFRPLLASALVLLHFESESGMALNAVSDTLLVRTISLGSHQRCCLIVCNNGLFAVVFTTCQCGSSGAKPLLKA